MVSLSPLPEPPPLPDARVASIVALVGRGMTAREIRKVFPDLESGAIRAALLHAAELMRDEDTSLQPADSVGRLIADAQVSAGMSEEDAVALAVSETQAARRSRAGRRK